MGSAITLRNIVGKAQYVFVVGIIPPERHFNSDAVFFRIQINRRINQRSFCAIKIFNELRKPAFIEEILRNFLRAAFVSQDNPRAGIQKSQFAKTLLESLEVKLHHGESVRGWHESYLCALFIATFTNHFKWSVRNTMGETDPVQFSIPLDFQFKRYGKSIHH